ncbi:MAG: DUF6495 family protein [Bacteroidota bacterium]
MKYRRLRKDELEQLETNFIRFLAAYSIDGPQWERLKKEQPAESDALIDKFSEVVFEKTLKNLTYLQYKTPKDIKVFHCLPDKMIMMGIMVEGESDLDFTKQDDKDSMLQQMRQSGAELKVYQAQKAYNGSREDELFKMMEHGCLISDGSLFQLIRSLVKA